jgi:phenylacetate-coenzyme A ligase PaaK-like adenylate-forming protein
VVIGHQGARDLVVVHVEMDDTSAERAVEAGIVTNLRERFGDFWRNREIGLYDLRVRVHPIGALRRQGRKLRRVVDERQMNDAPLVST